MINKNKNISKKNAFPKIKLVYIRTIVLCITIAATVQQMTFATGKKINVLNIMSQVPSLIKGLYMTKKILKMKL